MHSSQSIEVIVNSIPFYSIISEPVKNGSNNETLTFYTKIEAKIIVECTFVGDHENQNLFH